MVIRAGSKIDFNYLYHALKTQQVIILPWYFIQLLKEAEGWSERHSELREQIQMYQKSQKDIEETLAYKENEIEVGSV